MFKVQSVLLSRKSYTLEKAVNWLFANGFNVKKVDATPNYWRFRQTTPSVLRREGYTKYTSKDISPDIQFIIVYNTSAPQKG
jgi:hypothetical protein